MSNALTKLDRINKVAKFNDNIEYMNPNQMGSFIDVAPATIRSWIRNHKIKPAIEEGNTILLHRNQIIDCIILKNRFNSSINSNLFLVPLATANEELPESKKKVLSDNLTNVSGVKNMTYIDSFDDFKQDAYKNLSINTDTQIEDLNGLLDAIILQDIVSRLRDIIHTAIISKYRDNSPYIECNYRMMRNYLLGVASDEDTKYIREQTKDRLDVFKATVDAKINELFSEYNAKTNFDDAGITLEDLYYSIAREDQKTEGDEKSSLQMEQIKKNRQKYTETLDKLEKYPFDSSTQAYQKLVKSNIQAYMVSEISKKLNKLKEEGFYSIVTFNSADENKDVEDVIYSGVFNNIWLLNDVEMPENITQAVKNAEKMNNIKIYYQNNDFT